MHRNSNSVAHWCRKYHVWIPPVPRRAALSKAAKTGSFCRRTALLLSLRGDYLLQNSIQATRNPPTRVVGLELSQIRDVADVIALSCFFHVMPIQLASRELLDSVNGFQHRDAIAAPSAQVVDLSRPGVRGEFLNSA